MRLDLLTISYLCQVLATDGGLPPLVGTADVEFSVSDVNDNPPRIIDSGSGDNGPIVFHVRENAPYGTKVGKVSLTYLHYVPTSQKEIQASELCHGLRQRTLHN